MQRQRALKRGNHFRAPGMTDEAIDICGRKLHPGEHFDHRRTEMFGNEIGNRALEDDAKSFGVDAPAHDIERARPGVFRRGADLQRLLTRLGPQNDSRRAIAEERR